MTKIFFYHGMEDRLHYAVRLIAGAWAQKKVMTIYAPDPAIASALDALLWQQPPTSFIPHCMGDSPLAAETPILITSALSQSPQDERLINLSNELPEGFARFQSLVEVVSQEDDVKQTGRERVRFYRERGYDVQFKDIGGATA